MTSGERRARVVEVAVWAAGTYGIWLVTLSSVTAGDLEVAAPSALVAGLLASTARAFVGGVALGLPPGFWGWVVRLPVAVLTDTGMMAILAVSELTRRRHPGQLQAIQLPTDEAEDIAETRRAVGALVLGATPGSVPVDNDVTRRRMIVHQVSHTRPAWAAIDPAAQR